MRTRRAAGVALFAFFVAMACFGMLSRAIDDASVARVSVVRAAPQALAGAAGEMPDEPESPSTVWPPVRPLRRGAGGRAAALRVRNRGARRVLGPGNGGAPRERDRVGGRRALRRVGRRRSILAAKRRLRVHPPACGRRPGPGARCVAQAQPCPPRPPRKNGLRLPTAVPPHRGGTAKRGLLPWPPRCSPRRRHASSSACRPSTPCRTPPVP